MTDLFARCPMEYRPVIEKARACLPPAIERLTRTRFLCGISPLFVGLATYSSELSDGRSYHETGHVAYGKWHSSDRTTTVVLPRMPTEYTVIHELGHVLDEQTNFELDVPTTTPYSNNGRHERVAEAFALLLTPDYPHRGEWQDYLAAEPFRAFRELVFQ